MTTRTMFLLSLLPTVAFAWMIMSTPPPNTFPVSTRQALIQKAQQLKQSKGCYSTVGWSNRLGSVLTPAAVAGVYTADRPFYWNKIDVGCRMTVIELDSESSEQEKPDLWVHSPVPLDGPLQKVLSELGTVKHIVSPNYEHVSFARQWADAYPDATMWACPGLSEREPETRWTQEIPVNTMAEELWPGIAGLHVGIEANPFTGKPFFNEVIFYHIPSKSLLTTDLYWNYPQPSGVPNANLATTDEDESNDNGPWELAPAVDGIPIGSKLWKFGMDKIYGPFYNNLMVTNQEDYSKIQQVILEDWEVETLIPAHGDLIRGNQQVKDVLRRHFGV